MIDAGDYHTCGIIKGGRAYCWGDGRRGQLGIGSREFFRLVPTPVSGELSFSSISAGLDFTCGVTSDGEAYCWGAGSSGKLGNGSIDDRLTPTLVHGGLDFVEISAGFHTTCGVTGKGEAYCWGDGGMGQLGNGSEEDKLVPTMVRNER
jgi:alpha-tubulin suppressor-like RCC1 family protein